jgi:hypothetical protein
VLTSNVFNNILCFGAVLSNGNMADKSKQSCYGGLSLGLQGYDGRDFIGLNKYLVCFES